MKFKAIWYNPDRVVKEDIIESVNAEEAKRQAHTKYNGNPPAELLSIIPM